MELFHLINDSDRNRLPGVSDEVGESLTKEHEKTVLGSFMFIVMVITQLFICQKSLHYAVHIKRVYYYMQTRSD